MKTVDDLEKNRSNYGTKVRDIQISPEYDVETITPDTLDNLMKFLDMIPNENQKTINMKFHSRQLKKIKSTTHLPVVINTH